MTLNLKEELAVLSVKLLELFAKVRWWESRLVSTQDSGETFCVDFVEMLKYK